MTGEVTADNEAVLELEIYGPGGTPETIPTVVDTGFSDFLTLDPGTITRLGLPFEGEARVMLADGSIVTSRLYRVTVRWDGEARVTEAHEAGGGPLLGMAMLRGCRFTMDVLDGGVVRVQRL